MPTQSIMVKLKLDVYSFGVSVVYVVATYSTITEDVDGESNFDTVEREVLRHYQKFGDTELNFPSIGRILTPHRNNWGEPERAPHRRVCCGICLYYIYIIYFSYVVP